MAQPYVGEIRMFAGNFAPAGWMFCEGQLLPISENETLFQLIGTTYGGDGESTFALPDLRGRLPIHQGNGSHPRRDRRRRGGHADRATRFRHTRIPLLASTARRPQPRPAEQGHWRNQRRQRFTSAVPRPGDRTWHAAGHHTRGRQSAAHELPAVSVHQLHHFAVRDFPEQTVRRASWQIHSSPKSASFRSTSRPRAGRSAMGSCCRSRRTRRCSRCWARPTAATASRTFALAGSAGPRSDAPGPGTGAVAARSWARQAGIETVTLLESEMPFHPRTTAGQHRSGQPAEIPTAVTLARSPAGCAYNRTLAG